MTSTRLESSSCCHLNFRYGTCIKPEVSWRSVKHMECRFTLKLVRDMIITCSQMHRTDRNSQHTSIIWPVWLNFWVFVHELSGCGVESRCCSRDSFSTKIFCMIFYEKSFSRYILLTHQISLSGCLYFARYWAISVL